MALRIDFAIDGGLASLPGLRRPVTVDVDALPAERAQRLCDLVTAADFFTVHPPAVPAGSADCRTYTVTVHDGTRSRTLKLTEPIADPALRALVGEVRACVAAARPG